MKVKRLRNLTANTLNISGLTIASENEVGVPRVVTQEKRIDTITTMGGYRIEIYETTMRLIEGLPAFEKGTLLIVSLLVVRAAPSRQDLLFPAGIIKDPEGNIIGAQALSR